VLKDASQYRADPPYELTSKKYAADVNEVQSLGVKTGSTRTAEQTQIAYFWVESSPLQWNRIARTVSISGSPESEVGWQAGSEPTATRAGSG
jgi:hypothetical protein